LIYNGSGYNNKGYMFFNKKGCIYIVMYVIMVIVNRGGDYIEYMVIWFVVVVLAVMVRELKN